MGYFGFTSKYSKVEHPITSLRIKKLVSHYNVRSLDSGEEGVVENSIIARRHSDGKISLSQIYEVLTKLKNQNKISRVDRDGVMRVFEKNFGENN